MLYFVLGFIILWACFGLAIHKNFKKAIRTDNSAFYLFSTELWIKELGATRAGSCFSHYLIGPPDTHARQVRFAAHLKSKASQ